jgi:hypothetical protein
MGTQSVPETLEESFKTYKINTFLAFPILIYISNSSPTTNKASVLVFRVLMFLPNKVSSVSHSTAVPPALLELS